MNITTVNGFEEFKNSVIDPDTGASRVDLILSCVDNYEARITINQVSAGQSRWYSLVESLHQCLCMMVSCLKIRVITFHS